MIFPDFRRVQAGLQRSVQQVKEFRRLNPRGLNGSHFLVKLLGSLNVPLTLEAEIYNDKVSDIALNLAMSLKMTSPLSKGHIFSPGVFYGEHVSEVIMATIDPYDVKQMLEGWEDMQPIRVLYHPKTDLRLHVPDGRHPSEEAGVAVITVNIPMLASQYRRWRQLTNTKDESPRSIMQFLAAYPIPNMLDTHLDLAIMNRMIGQYFDVEMLDIRSHHSYYLIDWTSDIDKVLGLYLKYVQGRRWDFDTLITHMPVVMCKDLHEVLQLPDMAFTQQVQWGVVMARLALTTWLVQFNHNTDNPRNQQTLNYLRRYLRQMELNRILRSALPANRYDEVMVLIDNGIMPYL